MRQRATTRQCRYTGSGENSESYCLGPQFAWRIGREHAGDSILADRYRLTPVILLRPPFGELDRLAGWQHPDLKDRADDRSIQAPPDRRAIGSGDDDVKCRGAALEIDRCRLRAWVGQTQGDWYRFAPARMIR